MHLICRPLEIKTPPVPFLSWKYNGAHILWFTVTGLKLYFFFVSESLKRKSLSFKTAERKTRLKHLLDGRQALVGVLCNKSLVPDGRFGPPSLALRRLLSPPPQRGKIWSGELCNSVFRTAVEGYAGQLCCWGSLCHSSRRVALAN